MSIFDVFLSKFRRPSVEEAPSEVEVLNTLSNLGSKVRESELVWTFDNVSVNGQLQGINPKDALGAAKPDLSVVPPSSLLHLASAMMDGSVKYGPFNWRGNAVRARVYVAAAQRHLLQYLDGEDVDPTSKVRHLAHAMACCAILLDAVETGNLVDDRPVPGAGGDMIRRWTPEEKFKA